MSDVRRLLEVLEAVAPAEPMNQDEQGGCVWCGQTDGTAYGYATAAPEHHEPDCAWLTARKVLKEADRG